MYSWILEDMQDWLLNHYKKANIWLGGTYKVNLVT